MTTEKRTAEVELPRERVSQHFHIGENNIGYIEIESFHYPHSSELGHTIRVLDNRTEKVAWGKCVFEGTIEDLLHRLTGK